MRCFDRVAVTDQETFERESRWILVVDRRPQSFKLCPTRRIESKIGPVECVKSPVSRDC